MKLKIMEYNILHGFHSKNKPFTFQKERKSNVQKIVKKEDPDILILTEACFGDENKYNIRLDYEKMFDFQHYFYASCAPKEYEWGSAIFSKYPLTGKNLGENWISFLQCKIDIGSDFLKLNVFHPYPNIKEEQKYNFIKKFFKKTGKNQILAGDFNSINPKEYNKEKLLKGFKTFHKEPLKKVNELFKGKVISYLVSKGLIDTYKENNSEFNYTIPTDMLSKNKDSAMRIDHIFCSEDIKVLDSGIIKNELTEKASDHYPIYAVLDVGGKKS